MKNWNIELVTNGIISNRVELQAGSIEKVDYHNLLVDGVLWKVPKMLGISFARIEENTDS